MSKYFQEDGAVVIPQTNLTREQREAVGLLSIGTFLEYFDLMLYVHMVILLNELFFPKTDPHTAALLSALAFCSTYVLRPFGALIFGWIGDNIGRKATVVITTFMMAISCVIMATLPTYEQIGIIATLMVTICRILQGLSAAGEIVGAELYLTETIKPPLQYPIVSLIPIAAVLGGTFALGIASLCTIQGLNWRLAFWIGAIVALIGSIARTTLRDTPEFVDAKRRIQNLPKKYNINYEVINDNNSTTQDKINLKTIIFFFLISCAWPVCFYFVYIYSSSLLKNLFNSSTEQVMHQNFIVSIINLLGYLILAYLSYRIHPLKILKIKVSILLPIILICPYLLNYISTPLHLFFIQISFVLLLNLQPALAIFYSHIPILKRFTYTSFIYALSRALIHIITSFGMVYCIKYFGQWGLYIIMIPIITTFALGISYFKKLEIKIGNKV